MRRDARVYVAGHRGLVGSSLCRALGNSGYENLLVASRDEVDLRDQAAVNHWFSEARPEYVFLVAGTVGGVLANSKRPAEFIYDNVMIHTTVVHAAYKHEVRKLLYLGSSCIYPREAPQPMREEYLLTGRLEPTNEPYAIAKIAGIKLCQAYRRQYGCPFISAMPTNLYGPNDNFDLQSSHVIPALIHKFEAARVAGHQRVTIWGSGAARREFLYVDDLARACLFLMNHYDEEEHVNIGTGADLTVRELASIVRRTIYPAAAIEFDPLMPEGTLRKCLDVRKIHGLGWSHEIELPEGIELTYRWYLENQPYGVPTIGGRRHVK